ncbi:hypothetical protein N0V82_005490 [Gnomoniopsis sp. IMI 355080]|nr:hypothetical protein N0V82_005490 [Gnomoniopsis sp. IMI 355080]
MQHRILSLLLCGIWTGYASSEPLDNQYNVFPTAAPASTCSVAVVLLLTESTIWVPAGYTNSAATSSSGDTSDAAPTYGCEPSTNTVFFSGETTMTGDLGQSTTSAQTATSSYVVQSTAASPQPSTSSPVVQSTTASPKPSTSSSFVQSTTASPQPSTSSSVGQSATTSSKSSTSSSVVQSTTASPQSSTSSSVVQSTTTSSRSSTSSSIVLSSTTSTKTSASSSRSSTSSARPTCTDPPGMQWAYYVGVASTDCARTLDATYFYKATAGATGTSVAPIYDAGDCYNNVATFNTLGTTFNCNQATLIWHGYLAIPTTGIYTLTVPSAPDDRMLVWLGANAVSTWTTQNANVSENCPYFGTDTDTASNSVSIAAVAGQYVPFRVLFANVGGELYYDLTITAADGSSWMDGTKNQTTISSHIVQYSCSDPTAPRLSL